MQTVKDILVSVVMPVYNCELYLKEAIESILCQTYSNFEFIIVNDGSTDNTEEIILSYQDPRIIYLKNKTNQGNAFSRNLGHSMAKGKYIIIQDSDDISLPNRIERQVAFMENHADIGIAGSFVKVLEGEKSYIKKYPVNPEFIKAWLFFRNPIAQPSVIMRKSVLNEFNLSHLKYYEDFNLWYQASKVTKIANIPEVLIHYRYFEDEVKKKHREIKRHTVKILFRKKLDELGVEVREEDFDLLSDFIRAYVIVNFKEYKLLSNYLDQIGRANRQKKLYPMAAFEKCLLYDHLRLWKFLYQGVGMKALLKLGIPLKRVLVSGIRI
jgi:glycosyltransferase involved in cell wall biosynthesis